MAEMTGCAVLLLRGCGAIDPDRRIALLRRSPQLGAAGFHDGATRPHSPMWRDAAAVFTVSPGRVRGAPRVRSGLCPATLPELPI